MVIRGSYCLCILVKDDMDVNVGSLGVISFPKGLYIYVGSALNSLVPRLSRHLKTNRGQSRAIHWHIDYVLRHPEVEVEGVYATNSSIRMECEIAKKVAERGASVPRFGCSDCSCPSHLYRVEEFGFLKKIGLEKMDLGELTSS
jgi:Uri superfamily endonuclease